MAEQKKKKPSYFDSIVAKALGVPEWLFGDAQAISGEVGGEPVSDQKAPSYFDGFMQQAKDVGQAGLDKAGQISAGLSQDLDKMKAQGKALMDQIPPVNWENTVGNSGLGDWARGMGGPEWLGKGYDLLTYPTRLATDGRAMGALTDLWQGAEEPQPQAPKPPLAPPPNVMEQLLGQMPAPQGGGRAVAGPFSMTMGMPQIGAVPRTEIQAPDFSAARQAMQGAVPQELQGPGMLAYILGGLGQAQIDPNNLGATLLSMGLGSVGGLGQGMAGEAEMRAKNAEAQQEYALKMAALEQQIAGTLGDVNLAQAQMDQRGSLAEWEAKNQRAGMVGAQGAAGGIMMQDFDETGNLRMRFQPTITGSTGGGSDPNAALKQKLIMSSLYGQSQPVNIGKSLAEGNMPAGISPEAMARIASIRNIMAANEKYGQMPVEMQGQAIEELMASEDPGLLTYLMQLQTRNNQMLGLK